MNFLIFRKEIIRSVSVITYYVTFLLAVHLVILGISFIPVQKMRRALCQQLIAAVFSSVLFTNWSAGFGKDYRWLAIPAADCGSKI
jgi:hypothetical protein